jgi:Chaperone of endosialidase
MKMTTLPLKHSTNCAPFRLALLLIPLALACFVLATARAVDPPPDGGYPNFNTAEGEDALFNLDTSRGTYNTAIGFDALYSHTVGFYNTAVGASALFSNTSATENTAVGINALHDNTVGVGNTAVGDAALSSNTTGYYNTAMGDYALSRNTTGIWDTAIGSGALTHNTSGMGNTANGEAALSLNTIGNNNTANGLSALAGNDSGSYNTAVGSSALGYNTTGSNNIALGFEAGSKLLGGSNNIYIGSRGTSSESRTIRIGDPSTHGRTSIAGISGVAVAAGVGVIVDTNGQLGTVVSSERFKDEVKPMDKASEAILELKPVIFRYKHELDPKGIPQFGLVAEQVEKVDADLVARDDEGKPYTVRYEAVNAMLLNEFLKEHRAFVEERHKVKKLETEVTNLIASVKEQAAEIQRVSAQLDLSRPTLQAVVGNH